MNVPSTTQNAKPSFSDVWKQSGLDFNSIAETIAGLAKVEIHILEDMMLHLPVMPQEAQSVLTILSQHTGKTYTLETVDIPLIPLDINAPIIVQREQEGYEQTHIL